LRNFDYLFAKDMIAFPNAKINLGLHVVARRPDGFHNIESCFYPVDWTDVLEIIEAEALRFTASGLHIPGEAAHNLCLKAYAALKRDFDLPPVHMHLHKVIPIGAGLGGGSADAAFAVKLLNDKFELGLAPERMEDYVRPLGSDCAFFIQNKPLYCYDKGDRFASIELDLKGYWIGLVNPCIHVSTPEAYAGIVPQQPPVSLRDVLRRPVEEWRDRLGNDFERTVFVKYPAIATVKDKLYEAGALYASMSGSGATVYGIFAQPVPLQDHFPAEYTIWPASI
jgi:4-diphosphocytidyl-2-C-methyl-D-erythritol kinase